MNLRKKSQDFENIFKENESLKRENVFLNKENGELKSSFSKLLKEKENLDISLASQRSLCINHESICDHPSTSSCTTTLVKAKHDRT